jgi:pimeloyl-ACP methyl ester carboxylesterase
LYIRGTTLEEAAMFEHKYADLRGTRIHYVTAGKGKLIMFLHGFPEFWYEWKNQLKEFGRDYQAVAPDMRGYNVSSVPPEVEKYQTKHLVEDIRLLAEHLGHKKFVLVAHDWGGAVAWAFALFHPDYLEKLIIINAPHPFVFDRELRQNQAQQKASSYMLMFRSPKAEQILSENNYAFLVDTVLTDGLKKGYFNEDDRKAYIEAWSQPGALTGGLNYYRAASLGGLTGEGKGSHPSPLVLNVPTLVIWGESDRHLLTGNLEGLDDYVADLTIKRIPDGSHWVVHEKPEMVNRLMREFIEAI